MARKESLWKLLIAHGLAPSREEAERVVRAGVVRVNESVIDKPGTSVAREALICVDTPNPYVSRGGFKLAKALEVFACSVSEKVCADVGSSTGGFTDVLLQNGAAKVFAIDVGYGELDWRIRKDPRVVVMERTNARNLEALPEKPAFVSIDVSFISLDKILPAVRKWLPDRAEVVALVKPQFEAEREQVGEGGIVREPEVHRAVLTRVWKVAEGDGFAVAGLIPSPIRGGSGNREFLMCLRKGAGKGVDEGVVEGVVSSS